MLGKFLRDVIKLNGANELPHLRPRRDASNRWQAVFEVDRTSSGRPRSFPTTTT